MTKTYRTPDQKQEPDTGSRPRKSVGVYDRPVRAAPGRGLVMAIVAILAVVIIIMLYRLAVGEGLQGKPHPASGTGSHPVLSYSLCRYDGAKQGPTRPEWGQCAPIKGGTVLGL